MHLSLENFYTKGKNWASLYTWKSCRSEAAYLHSGIENNKSVFKHFDLFYQMMFLLLQM